jgi:hypothetical protein
MKGGTREVISTFSGEKAHENLPIGGGGVGYLEGAIEDGNFEDTLDYIKSLDTNLNNLGMDSKFRPSQKPPKNIITYKSK